MELLIIAFVILAIVFVVVRAVVRATTRPLEPAERRPMPWAASGSSTPTDPRAWPQASSDPVITSRLLHPEGAVTVSLHAERPVALERPPAPDSARWVPAGESVGVASYTIPDGLLFVGENLRALNGYQTEPALINPRLSVDRHDLNRAGTNVPYWPSYSTISPGDRAAYLEWLAGGRSDPDAYIGYVFLFFYGLERRALAGPEPLENATPDLRAITREVERLLSLYGPRSRSFAGYAGGFLSLFTAATQQTARSYEGQPPAGLVAGELPLLLKLGLGQAAADQRPLPVDWARAWVEATTPLRTPATRCPDEFRALFRVRYAEVFGEGLRLSSMRTKLAWTYRPASASFGGQFTVQLDVPDVTAQARPLTKLVALAERCCDDLDAYSRWVGRHRETSGLATVALLPAEIAASHASEDVEALCRSLETAIGGGRQAVIDADPLIRAWPSETEGKLAKADAVLLAQALERRGYGLEPDVRFGGRVLTAPGHAVAFRLSTGTPTAASRSYEAATLLVHLAAVLAMADDDVDEAERGYVVDHLQTALHLAEAERARLTAHFTWLQLDPPGNAGIKKRVATVAKAQREEIAKFLVTLAAADGRIAPAEVAALTKIYGLLGLDPQSAYRDVHALGELLREEPVTVRPASPTREFTIPEGPGAEVPIALDMRRVARTLADTAAVTAILDEVFNDDEEVAPQAGPKPGPAATGRPPDTRSRERELLRALGERAEWSRLEFEHLAERLRLMPDGALERLNEAALDRFGAPVCDGDDPIVIHTTLIKEMLA